MAMLYSFKTYKHICNMQKYTHHHKLASKDVRMTVHFFVKCPGDSQGIDDLHK
jgi:hypothetical protein